MANLRLNTGASGAAKCSAIFCIVGYSKFGQLFNAGVSRYAFSSAVKTPAERMTFSSAVKTPAERSGLNKSMCRNILHLEFVSKPVSLLTFRAWRSTGNIDPSARQPMPVFI